MIVGLAMAALMLSVEGKCTCNKGTGNSWIKDRACGTLTDDDGVWFDMSDGSKKCQMRPLDDRNRCPEYAPVEEENTDPIHFGFVWCDCMDEHQRIVKAATEKECLRTEGLTDEQDIAYQAAGLNTREYSCACCACQSTIHGVPKIGDKAKTCDAGGTDASDIGGDCAITTYYAFAAALVLLCLVGAYWKKKQMYLEELEEEKKKKKGKTQDSG